MAEQGEPAPSRRPAVGRLAGDLAIKRAIATRGAGEGEMPSARAPCGQAQPPAFAAILDQRAPEWPASGQHLRPAGKSQHRPRSHARRRCRRAPARSRWWPLRERQGRTARSAPARQRSRPSEPLAHFCRIEHAKRPRVAEVSPRHAPGARFRRQSRPARRAAPLCRRATSRFLASSQTRPLAMILGPLRPRRKRADVDAVGDYRGVAQQQPVFAPQIVEHGARSAPPRGRRRSSPQTTCRRYSVPGGGCRLAMRRAPPRQHIGMSDTRRPGGRRRGAPAQSR